MIKNDGLDIFKKLKNKEKCYNFITNILNFYNTSKNY